MPVLQDTKDGYTGSSLSLSLKQDLNIFLQLITAAQLVHFLIIRRRSPSLLLAICTLLVIVTYIATPTLDSDLHFLILASRIPHPIAEPGLHTYWYNAALVIIFASAFLQLQDLSRHGVRLSTSNRKRGLNWTPEWLIVGVGLAGAIALAAMRSPVLEAFLGSDFDKTRRLSGASVVIAFLLLLWRGVTFLDIFSTTYSLSESTERDKIVLALWQRASLPMAAELIFDILSIIIYESITFKTFSREEVGLRTAGIQVFDSPMAIALTTLGVALAKSFAERNARSSSVPPSDDKESLSKN